MWDVSQYTRFQSERSRPFFDLVAQIPATDPKVIVDLGCGTGELTATLLDRWPGARILGVDSSLEMLKKAATVTRPGQLEFLLSDIADWKPDQLVDVLLSNAALHWLPDHEQLIPRLASYLATDGVLAVQMPNRFRAPSQQAIEDTIAASPWRDRLRGIGLHRESVLPTETYARLLMQLGFAVDAWETTYIHVLHGENASLEWFKGTALRPLLAALDAEQQAEFQRALATRLNDLYPPRDGFTLLPMQRLFFVAARSAE